MSGICRVGIDSAGGIIIGAQNNTVFANGYNVAVDGDAVQGHGTGMHSNPTMIANSSVYINGKMACKAGNLATCGHEATGSDTVFIG